MPNQSIVKTIYGSHLFGLNTDSSDQDYKGVFQSSLSDIILGRDVKTINSSTSSFDQTNTSTDIDTEFKELRTFIGDCLDGQTYAIEMLFTPPSLILETSPIWQFIQANRVRLIPRDLKAFASYAFSHSAKYSLRGERLQELQRVIVWFELQDQKLRLRDVIDDLQLSDYTFTEIYKHKLKTQSHPDEQRLCCLGMIFQYNKSIAECTQILTKRLLNYGPNALPKEAIEIDWKAYSHVSRLLSEWEQLLTESRLTFPIPSCEWILQVKKGTIPMEVVQDKIFEEFVRISKLPNKLPDADTQFWHNWLVAHYSQRQLIF
jgi:RNA repair pathway DNA polymerase beta family